MNEVHIIFCNKMVVFIINKFSDKLTTAKYNVAKSKVRRSQVAFLWRSLVHLIDDKRYALNFAPILTSETLANTSL